MTIHAILTLEQIVLKLKTISEPGDIVKTLTPAVRIIRTIESAIASLYPERVRELKKIKTLLSGIIVDAGESLELTIDFKKPKEEAQKILKETASATEQEMKKLPKLPPGLPEKK